MKKENKKGGKRAGSGRKPGSKKKEAVTVYVEVAKYGGKEGARIAIYEFLDGHIWDTGKSSFLPLPDNALAALHNAENKDQFTKTHLVTKKKSQEPVAPKKPQTSAPKNLDELKALCPTELTGLDRSQWIAKERQKYGI